jgi:hypothetical protein
MTLVGLSWPEVVTDLEQVESVTPIRGFETRQRWMCSRVQAYVEPGVTREGESSRIVLSVRCRRRVEPEPDHVPVVGVEPRVVGPRYRGHGGSSWPRTWAELLQRLEEVAPDASVGRGGKHLAVFREGKRVATLPMSSSDHRGLVNACTQLRAAGIDLSRR